MKKSSELLVLVALLAAAFVVPNLSAQDNSIADRPARGARGGAHDGKAADALGLTTEQQTQLKAIGDEQRAAAEKIRNDATLTQEQKRAQLQTLRQGFEDQRKAVLTPEQQAKAAEFRKNAGERRGGGPGGQGGQGGEGRRPRRGGGGGE